jgi:tetratricopeptide (TPR) repeat protein
LVLRRCSLLLQIVAVLAASSTPQSAFAQPVIDEFVVGARVQTTWECALLTVHFHTQLRYAGHFPQQLGEDLRITLNRMDPRFIEELPRVRREGVAIDNPDFAELRSVTLDLSQPGGLELRILFYHPVAYQVAQFGDFTSIAVIIQKPGSTKTCSLGDFANPSADQKTAAGGTALGVERGGFKVTPGAMQMIEASMDEARAALKKNKYSEAITLLEKVLRYAENKHSEEAQELLAEALQKAGQTDAARAEYEAYLRRYPEGEGRDRVKRQLAIILAATGQAPEVPENAAPRFNNGRAEHTGETQWSLSGSVSSFYIQNDSTSTAKDISTAPDPNADPDAHRVHQNTFLTNFDLSGSINSDEATMKFRFAGTDERSFQYTNTENNGRYGISTALIGTTLKESGISALIGRQTRNSGGVYGRLDGAVVSFPVSDSIRLNAVAGSPNWSRFDAPFKYDRYLYGTSVDFSHVLPGLDTSLFVIEQRDRSVIDRRGVGAEFRYFDNNKSAFGTIDYDIHFNRLNAAIFSGSWTFADKSVLAGGVNYQRVPYLSTWNAIQGQPYLTLYDMLKLSTQEQVQQFAIDRTPDFESAMVSYSRPLSENFQFGADATVTSLSGTPPSGGVDGTFPSGTEYYLSAQLSGTNIFKPGDMFVGALRYASLADSNVYFLDVNTRYPITNSLLVSPRIRLGYRYGTTTDLREVTVLPTLLVNYQMTKDLGLEAEVGYDWTSSTLAHVKSVTNNFFVTLGVRYDFNADGAYKCAGVLAPCIALLTGQPHLDPEAAATDKAFYGHTLYDKELPDVSSAFVVEGGLRYWYSSGKNKYDYHADNNAASAIVSRLSYNSLTANSGELFFRADAREGIIRNFFVKGSVGGGNVGGGKLIDEDFAPFVSPYSRTVSSTNGKLEYGNIDVGYNLYTNSWFRGGAFVGFQTWLESVAASGCQQTGQNQAICVPAIGGNLKLVNERDRWNSYRIGAVLDVNITDRLKWNGEFAFTSTSHRPTDDHFFTFGLDPARGNGMGYEIETILKYDVTDRFSVGLGGRWWHMKTDAVDRFGQLLKYKTDRYGVFLQGSYTLDWGKYPAPSSAEGS